jgi:hypothetical protein
MNVNWDIRQKILIITNIKDQQERYYRLSSLKDIRAIYENK